ncbi:DUF4276 family protein [Carboxydichorda subterranea]|uniref:DUF4276 family protein n=1 Tax=Carboxydichorda subterranea TaxID=3109565 RepID=UPI0038578911
MALVKVDDPAILVLFDADDDCPATMGPGLLQMAEQVLGRQAPVAVVLAKAEYETWFVACLDQLHGKRGIRRDARVPHDPEAIRGAKEYLEQQMTPGRFYSETVDQPALTQLIDVERTRSRSPSFDKLWREVERLVLRGRPSPS